MSNNDIHGPRNDASGPADQQPAKTLMKSLLETLRAAQEQTAVEADQLGLLGASFDACPFPCWIKVRQKDGALVMARVNRAFETQVGVSGSSYFAKTDETVWGADVAAQVKTTDKEVLADGVVVESTPIIPDPVTGLRYQWRGVKWPLYVRGEIVGLAGMSTRGEIVS